jgi:C4-dicarboxylate transporter, DctQ subunit
MLKWIENILMAGLAVATLVLVSYEAVVRYLFPRNLTDWGMEVTIYLTVWAIFIAGAPLVRESRHVRADILLIMLPGWAQRALEILALLVGLAFALALTWYGAQMVMRAYSLGENSESSIRFPLWVFYLALPVGTALMVPPFLHRLYLYLFHFDPKTMLVTHEQVIRDK